MKQIADCAGVPLPVFGKGTVVFCAEAADARPAGSVFLLKLRLAAGAAEPVAGQFYLLRAEKSGVLLGRPISVYAAETS
ncbi:MAG: dihydroorotate dehydrogenase, partial [Treponemataceae bacterium]|nr:dihydroorotate dehydrogenase [Treponemataceae bacterium]